MRDDPPGSDLSALRWFLLDEGTMKKWLSGPLKEGWNYVSEILSGFQAPEFERMPAPNKRFAETVVFVPFFGGKKVHLRRHAEFLNELGFDVVLFQLSHHDKVVLTGIPLGTNFQFGLKHLWAREINSVLNRVAGPKVVFAFSNPSSAAIETIVQRYKSGERDVRALICDSGPFVRLWRSNWNYLTQEMKIANPLTKIALNSLVQVLWCPNHEASLSEDLEQFPLSIPILSIRGWRDSLVPVSSINKAFDGHRNLNLEELALPEAEHLTGLRDFPNEYKPSVERFLRRHLKPAGI